MEIFNSGMSMCLRMHDIFLNLKTSLHASDFVEEIYFVINR